MSAKMSWADMVDEEETKAAAAAAAASFDRERRPPAIITTFLCSSPEFTASAAPPPPLPAVAVTPPKAPKKPRRYSRRAATRAANAGKIEEERRLRAQVAVTKSALRVAIRVRLLIHRLLTKTRRKLMRLEQVRHKKLRHWIAAFRTRKYLDNLKVYTTTYWLDTNCSDHVATSIIHTITKSSQSKNGLPTDVKHIINVLREVKDATPLMQHYERDELYKGQMIRVLQQQSKLYDTVRNLHLHTTLKKHYRNPRLRFLSNMMVNCMENRVFCWKNVVSFTFAYVKAVHSTHQVPDKVLMSALRTLALPKETDDPIVKRWSEYRCCPPVYGFPLSRMVAKCTDM